MTRYEYSTKTSHSARIGRCQDENKWYSCKFKYIAGPGGRTVKDKSFYMAELRQKNSLLTNEINRLNAEFENVTKENANVAAFENK